MSRVELQILWLPVIAGVLLGTNGIIGAAVSGSQAVLLDGLFSFTYVIVGLLTVWAGHLVTTDDDRYPKGRSGIEPLINILKSLLLLTVVAYTVIEAISTIAGGGKTISYGSAVVFTLVSAGITLTATLFSWLRSKKDPTPLVRGDVINWIVDAAAILGVALALGIAAILNANGQETLARFIDPLLAITLGILTVYLPLKLGGTAILEIIGRSTTGKDREEIRDAIEEALAGEDIDELTIDVYTIGRERHVNIFISPARDTPSGTLATWHDDVRTTLDRLDSSVRFTMTTVPATPGLPLDDTHLG